MMTPWVLWAVAAPPFESGRSTSQRTNSTPVAHSSTKAHAADRVCKQHLRPWTRALCPFPTPADQHTATRIVLSLLCVLSWVQAIEGIRINYKMARFISIFEDGIVRVIKFLAIWLIVSIGFANAFFVVTVEVFYEHQADAGVMDKLLLLIRSLWSAGHLYDLTRNPGHSSALKCVCQACHLVQPKGI